MTGLFAFVCAAAATAAVADVVSARLHASARNRRVPRPFGLMRRVGRSLLPATAPAMDALDLRLEQAGRPGGLSGRDLLATKAGSAMAAAACGLLAGTLLPGRLGLVTAVLAPVAGFLAPDLWLARRRREHLRSVRHDLPPLLDLLRVSIEAGQSVPQALAEVGRRSRTPLARTWGGIAAQVAVGLPLADALAAHRRALPVAEVEAFTGALERATRHGAPLSATLAAQARESRLARARAVQEEAARAGPKMQLVVALLLVPSVMLLVAAALLSAMTGGGRGSVPLV